MSEPIDVWWPQLETELRAWIVNNCWSPMHEYARSEIRRHGGPDDDDPFWETWDDGSHLLPQTAVSWLHDHPDTTSLRKARPEPDPRAAYFARGHWHRG